LQWEPPEFATNIKKTIKDAFGGTLISGGDIHTANQAEELINDGVDLVYIGRPYIANPGLIEKLKNQEELTQPDFEKFYSPGEEGYIDYA